MIFRHDGRGHIYNINSLEFPLGHLADLPSAKKEIPLGSVDIIATNPPFGSDIPITDKQAAVSVHAVFLVVSLL